MSKSDKKKANKAEFQKAMGRLEDAVKELGDAAKENYADRAADVLEQTAVKLRLEVSSMGDERTRASDDESHSLGAKRSRSYGDSHREDEGRLGHWRGEGSARPYRDLDNGRLWGICAGIAPYLGLEIWVVRCLAVTALIFAPQIIVPAYIIGYFVLDPRSELDELLGARTPQTTSRMRKRHARSSRRAARAEAKAEKRAQRQEAWAARRARKKSARRSSGRVSEREETPLPARNVLRNVRGTLNEAELRLRRMEGHVTSGRYELQKELRKIDSSAS